MLICFQPLILKALACGTTVITYKTGGYPVAIDEKTGVVVKHGDFADEGQFPVF